MNKQSFIEWTKVMEEKLAAIGGTDKAVMAGTMKMIRETVETGQFDDKETLSSDFNPGDPVSHVKYKNEKLLGYVIEVSNSGKRVMVGSRKESKYGSYYDPKSLKRIQELT